MKERVVIASVHAMEWTADPEMPGLFTKTLNRDPGTGARTALQRIDTSLGYRPPVHAHFHEIEEELFVLSGSFTFDQKNWLGPGSYCYHPARTVHGFKSAVDGEAWFLSRSTAPVEIKLLESPPDGVDRPYSLDGTRPPRSVRVLIDPRKETWTNHEREGRPLARSLVLSADPSSGEGSSLVDYLPGAYVSGRDDGHDFYRELFVVEGELIVDGTPASAGYYAFLPSNEPWPELRSEKGASLYCNYGPGADPAWFVG